MNYLALVAFSLWSGLISAKITVFTPENSPRFVSDLIAKSQLSDYGVSDSELLKFLFLITSLAIYVDVYAKRSFLNKLLTYLNQKDTIAQKKKDSPGIDMYGKEVTDFVIYLKIR